MIPILNSESDANVPENPHKFLSVDFACHLPKRGRNKRSQVAYSVMMRRKDFFEGVFSNGSVYNTQLRTYHQLPSDTMEQCEMVDFRSNDHVQYQLMFVRDYEDKCVPCHFRLSERVRLSPLEEKEVETQITTTTVKRKTETRVTTTIRKSQLRNPSYIQIHAPTEPENSTQASTPTDAQIQVQIPSRNHQRAFTSFRKTPRVVISNEDNEPMSAPVFNTTTKFTTRKTILFPIKRSSSIKKSITPTTDVPSRRSDITVASHRRFQKHSILKDRVNHARELSSSASNNNKVTYVESSQKINAGRISRTQTGGF